MSKRYIAIAIGFVLGALASSMLGEETMMLVLGLLFAMCVLLAWAVALKIAPLKFNQFKPWRSLAEPDPKKIHFPISDSPLLLLLFSTIAALVACLAAVLYIVGLGH